MVGVGVGRIVVVLRVGVGSVGSVVLAKTVEMRISIDRSGHGVFLCFVLLLHTIIIAIHLE